MDRFINTALLRNPVNWIVVALMVTLASLGLRLIFVAASGDDSTGN